MESGLEGRNNQQARSIAYRDQGLNGVRPRRPEQYEKIRRHPAGPKLSQWSPA